MCLHCDFPDVERVREWGAPGVGHHVVHYAYRKCGDRFNHYVDKGNSC
jgi:ribosomal protein L37E